jgi:hypothetical protein
MADISMCGGTNCPQKQDCYRYRAQSDGEDQTFASFDKQKDTAENCQFFWSIDAAEGPLADPV